MEDGAKKTAIGLLTGLHFHKQKTLAMNLSNVAAKWGARVDASALKQTSFVLPSVNVGVIVISEQQASRSFTENSIVTNVVNNYMLTHLVVVISQPNV